MFGAINKKEAHKMKNRARVIQRLSIVIASGFLLSVLCKTYVEAGTLTVGIGSDGGQEVTVNNETFTEDYVAKDTPLTIAATPADSYEFSNWTVEGLEPTQYSSLVQPTLEFNMPDGNVSVTAYFSAVESVPVIEQPSPQPTTSNDDSNDSSSDSESQDPPKSETEKLQEQTSNIVDGEKSTIPGVNLATTLNGFAVAAPVASIASGLDKGEDLFTKVYNFDAKKSTAAKSVIDTVAAGSGLTVGKTINFEMGTVKGGKYTPAEVSGKIAESVPVKLGAPGGYIGAIQVSENGKANILDDMDTNPNTVTVEVAPVRSVIALVK